MTLGAGPLGYRDWQRVVNCDGPVLLNLGAAELTGNFTSAAIDVSRFGYLAGRMNVGTNPVNVFISWFADQALTVQLGERLILLDPSIAEGYVRIPNLGPWLQIKLAPNLSNTKWHPVVRLIGTNRVQ